jgi:uncharacterized protein (DUF433 family)
VSATALFDTEYSDVVNALAETSASRDGFIAAAQKTIDMTIVLVQDLRNSWQVFFARPEKGMEERARALRADFVQRLGQTLELARFAIDYAARAALVASQPLRDATRLAEVTAELEAVQREALTQWGISADMAASLAAMADFPLRLDRHGDIRIGRSRVLLDTIIDRYKSGATPKEIAKGYDTLTPAEISEAIAYYLRHKDDVDAYLQRRDAEAQALWEQIHAVQPSKSELKERIKERWARREADNAAPSE